MVNIKIKDLKCQTFFVEIDESLTVKHLKEKLAEEKKLDYAPDKQLLIYGGKVLQDDSLLTSLDINNDKFVVVMQQRAVRKSAEMSSSSDNISGDSGDCIKKKPQANVKPSSNRSSAKYSEKKKDKSTSVKEVSLTETICENLSLEAVMAITSNVDFQRIRNMVEKDPARLEIIVEHIARSNPALYKLITANKDHFLSLLSTNVKSATESKEASSRTTGRRDTANAQVQAGSGMHSRANEADVRLRSPLRSGSDEPSASVSMRLPSRALTQGEKEAIERLKAMGFEENLVIQAYFACEKDENSAANFLLQQHEDDS